MVTVRVVSATLMFGLKKPLKKGVNHCHFRQKTITSIWPLLDQFKRNEYAPTSKQLSLDTLTEGIQTIILESLCLNIEKRLNSLPFLAFLALQESKAKKESMILSRILLQVDIGKMKL